MKVLIAPDSFGGTLSAAEVVEAFVRGWREQRPSDDVRGLPLSDGGEGLLQVLALLHPEATLTTIEVAGTDTRPTAAPLLWLDERTVVIESATICGLPPAGVPRRPFEATSYGVGQALAHVVAAGARDVVVGLGGTGVVDGGSGALNGLGMRLQVADGSGLRVGAGDLASCVSVEQGWSTWPDDVRLTLLVDSLVVLDEAASRFGPQKGVAEQQVGPLAGALRTWASVLTRALPGPVDASTPGTGAAGGLGLALSVALGGHIAPGATWFAERAGLDAAVAAADLIVTGEGRLDATSGTGKVVSHVVAAANAHGRAVAAVVGSVAPGAAEALGIPPGHVVTAPAAQPGQPARDAVRSAAAILAARMASLP